MKTGWILFLPGNDRQIWQNGILPVKWDASTFPHWPSISNMFTDLDVWPFDHFVAHKHTQKRTLYFSIFLLNYITIKPSYLNFIWKHGILLVKVIDLDNDNEIWPFILFVAEVMGEKLHFLDLEDWPLTPLWKNKILCYLLYPLY